MCKILKFEKQETPIRTQPTAGEILVNLEKYRNIGAKNRFIAALSSGYGATFGQLQDMLYDCTQITVNDALGYIIRSEKVYICSTIDEKRGVVFRIERAII
jgi:hypothetical protein